MDWYAYPSESRNSESVSETRMAVLNLLETPSNFKEGREKARKAVASLLNISDSKRFDSYEYNSNYSHQTYETPQFHNSNSAIYLYPERLYDYGPSSFYPYNQQQPHQWEPQFFENQSNFVEPTSNQETAYLGMKRHLNRESNENTSTVEREMLLSSKRTKSMRTGTSTNEQMKQRDEYEEHKSDEDGTDDDDDEEEEEGEGEEGWGEQEKEEGIYEEEIGETNTSGTGLNEFLEGNITGSEELQGCLNNGRIYSKEEVLRLKDLNTAFPTGISHFKEIKHLFRKQMQQLKYSQEMILGLKDLYKSPPKDFPEIEGMTVDSAIRNHQKARSVGRKNRNRHRRGRNNKNKLGNDSSKKAQKLDSEELTSTLKGKKNNKTNSRFENQKDERSVSEGKVVHSHKSIFKEQFSTLISKFFTGSTSNNTS